MPIAQGSISLPIFVIHDLINEYNGGRRYYLLRRITLKNSFRIYLLLQSLALITSYRSLKIYLIFCCRTSRQHIHQLKIKISKNTQKTYYT